MSATEPNGAEGTRVQLQAVILTMTNPLAVDNVYIRRKSSEKKSATKCSYLRRQGSEAEPH